MDFKIKTTYEKLTMPALLLLLVMIVGSCIDMWIVTPGEQGWITWVSVLALVIPGAFLVIAAWIINPLLELYRRRK